MLFYSDAAILVAFYIDLIAFLKKELSDRVSDVVESKRLSDSPCVLVTAQGGVSQNMERLMKMADRDFSGSKRVLEVNPRHPIIQNLALRFKQERNASDLQDWAHMLVDYVLLGEGKVEDPQRVTRILQLMMQTTIESSLGETENA